MATSEKYTPKRRPPLDEEFTTQGDMEAQWIEEFSEPDDNQFELEESRKEIAGYRRMPDDDDISSQFPSDDITSKEKGTYSGLGQFWKEATGVAGIEQYVAVGRTVPEGQRYAERVVLSGPGGRHEDYIFDKNENGDFNMVDVRRMDEEGHQHGFQPVFSCPFERIPEFLKAVATGSDEYEWRDWDGDLEFDLDL